MRHISLDLEAFSTKPYATIIQIGAVEFNIGDLRESVPPALGATFKVNIDAKSSAAVGCVVDGDTIKWWNDQSDEAKASVRDPSIRLTFEKAMRAFATFVEGTGARYVWGNGATFDCSRLSEAYELSNVERPWHYKGDQDLRTLRHSVKLLGRKIPPLPIQDDPEFVKHDGLWDAKSQAQEIQYAYRELAKGLRCSNEEAP